jgi:GTPase SAR1 family protein
MSAIKNIIIANTSKKVKLAFIGLPGAGKSTLANKIIQQEDDKIQAIVNQKTNIEYQMAGNITIITWDLEESIPFDQSLWKRSITNADVIVFLFDTTSEQLMAKNKLLISEFVTKQRPTKLLILGSKSDLPSSLSETSIEELLDLPSIRGKNCQCKLIKYSSRTGEELFTIGDWLDKNLFKKQDPMINYVRINLGIIFDDKGKILSEILFNKKPDITLLSAVRELKRKIRIFASTKRVYSVAEEVFNLGAYRAILYKENAKIIALLIRSNDSIQRTFSIARILLSQIDDYSAEDFALDKLVADLYPLDVIS